MKKLYFCFFLLLLAVTNSNAQNTCSTPYQFKTGTSFMYPLAYGTPNTDTSNYYSCLPVYDNATWFYMNICTPGSFYFNVSSVGSSATDLSYIVWGPLTDSVTCGYDSSQVVNCGFMVGPTATFMFNTPYYGIYKIMIANYSDTAGYFTISQTGSGSSCDAVPVVPGGCTGAIQAICKVSTDPVVNHNFIYWDKDTNYTGTYEIQRETTTMGIYSTIATIANNDTSVYEDTISNPMIQSFKYRIKTVDTCTNVYYGTPHTTIHLLTSMSFMGDPQLSWNPYAGFSYGTYYIYRGSSVGTMSLYDSISASFTTYTDVSAAPGTNYYAVSVFPPVPCNPSRSSFDNSFSNVSSLTVTGISESTIPGLSLSPNPASNELNINTAGTYSYMNVELYDISGRKLIEKAAAANSSRETLDLSSISNGYYVVRIVTDKGMAQRRIIVSR